MSSYSIYPFKDLTPLSSESTPKDLGESFGKLPNEILEIIFENIANTKKEYGQSEWIWPAKELVRASKVCRTFHTISVSCLQKIHYKITNDNNKKIDISKSIKSIFDWPNNFSNTKPLFEKLLITPNIEYKNYKIFIPRKDEQFNEKIDKIYLNLLKETIRSELAVDFSKLSIANTEKQEEAASQAIVSVSSNNKREYEGDDFPPAKKARIEDNS